MSLWSRLSDRFRPFKKCRKPTLVGGTHGEHAALEELYQDSDGSAPWLATLLRFTASHLEGQYRLDRRERREVKAAESADSAIVLLILERLHEAAHGGAYRIRERVSSTLES